MSQWHDMSTAPKGVLIDLRFGGIRHTDCISRGETGWQKEHGYPSMTRVFMIKPDGWMPRPDGLVLPYETDQTGRQYIP